MIDRATLVAAAPGLARRTCFTRVTTGLAGALFYMSAYVITNLAAFTVIILVARAVGLSRYVPFREKSASFQASPGESFHAVNVSALSTTLPRYMITIRSLICSTPPRS